MMKPSFLLHKVCLTRPIGYVEEEYSLGSRYLRALLGKLANIGSFLGSKFFT